MATKGQLIRLGIRSSHTQTAPQPRPEFLLQTEILNRGNSTHEGVLVQSIALTWFRILDQIDRDPEFLFQFSQEPRKFEEFIAATYDRDGWEVTLTPRRGDRGRDVIAVKRGHGALRFLDQTKAYAPGHLVTHDDVRAMLGTLSDDFNSSKGLITTTSDFQPGLLKPDSSLAKFIPFRLELKNGESLRQWLKQVRAQSAA